MENAAVNKAHQQHRRAEAHLRYRRFADAIECHKTAADLITEALSSTQNSHAIESLKLQRDFHLRQNNVIHVKKEQYENFRKAVENQRHRATYCNSNNDDYEITNDNLSTSLQVAIYRNMEEADSLLGRLIKRGSGGNSDSESLKSVSTDTDDKPISIDAIDSSNSNQIVGYKHPTDDNTVIEELRTLNEQLHALVYKLVTQLDASSREVDMLKEKVKQLENEKYNKAQSKNSTNSLRVVTDSSGGTSPYVFSPCSEFSPDILDQRVLPQLAPLEMPNFDFTNFVKNNSNPNSNNVIKF